MYYDGGCPLCRREVAHYRRLDSDARVRWLDLSEDPSELQQLGVSLAEGMARLHARDRLGLRGGLAGAAVLSLARPVGSDAASAASAGFRLPALRRLALSPSVCRRGLRPVTTAIDVRTMSGSISGRH
jgi:predicted DCC family thiol-disulfide oxidoreductase YuxK